MADKKKKPNKRARSAIRKAKIAAGTYIAPINGAKKKKPTKKTVDAKSKVAVDSIPEFAPVERQSPFMPQKEYVTGGGIVRPILLKSGWRLSTDDRPDPAEYRLAAMSSVPQPEGTVKLLRFVLRDERQAELRASAERILKQIRDQERRDIADKELRLLIAKNLLNGQPLLAMRKIS